MNRIIKFRIWSKKYNNWTTFNPVGTHCSSNWTIDAFTGNLINYVNCAQEYIPESEPEYYMVGCSVIGGSPYVKCQYIGTRDKNNVEIYEGDIIKYKSFDGWKDEIGAYVNAEVYCNCDRASFVYSRDRLNFSHGHSIINSNSANTGLDVIGNIFENPELLQSYEESN